MRRDNDNTITVVLNHETATAWVATTPGGWEHPHTSPLEFPKTPLTRAPSGTSQAKLSRTSDPTRWRRPLIPRAGISLLMICAMVGSKRTGCRVVSAQELSKKKAIFYLYRVVDFSYIIVRYFSFFFKPILSLPNLLIYLFQY